MFYLLCVIAHVNLSVLVVIIANILAIKNPANARFRIFVVRICIEIPLLIDNKALSDKMQVCTTLPHLSDRNGILHMFIIRFWDMYESDKKNMAFFRPVSIT